MPQTLHANKRPRKTQLCFQVWHIGNMHAAETPGPMPKQINKWPQASDFIGNKPKQILKWAQACLSSLPISHANGAAATKHK